VYEFASEDFIGIWMGSAELAGFDIDNPGANNS